MSGEEQATAEQEHWDADAGYRAHTEPPEPIYVSCWCGDVGLTEPGSCGDAHCVPKPLTEAAQQAIASIRRDVGRARR